MNIIEFDKKCVCGPEFVCVRILDNCDNLKVGTLVLPSSIEANGRLAHCIIEDVGAIAAEKHGIKVGDYVMIDRLSTFAHTQPVALLKYDSVIMKTNVDRSEFYPLRNMLFVEPDEKSSIIKVDGIYVPSSADRLNLGTIVKMNCDAELNLPFKENDVVVLTKGADVVSVDNKTIRIYKHDMIVCVVKD